MKKRNIKTYLIIAIITVIYSCNNEKKIIGIYSTENTINTIDTLILKNTGEYERILRRKSDSSLIFKNKNVWYLSKSDNRIELSNYLIDDDDKYKIKKIDYFDDILMNASLPFYSEKGKTIIMSGNYNEIIYVKR